MRRFDPRAVGRYECRAWETYYRRKWAAFLIASVALVRAAFRMSWPKTLYGAWLVLRANQPWARPPDNDPEGARRCMRKFYALVRRRHRERFDVAQAARLEVEWWRVHRIRQRETPGAGEDALVAALVALYAHVYGVAPQDVRTAAAERTRAMDLSDAWVAAGCDRGSPMIDEERAALVRSYAALLAAVHAVRS
jgi:hypothetical protein